MRRSLSAVCIGLSLLALAACKGPLTGSVTGNPQATAPIEIKDGDPVMVPGFAIVGKYVAIDSEWAQAFEYANDDDAARDQSKVSPDGQTVDGRPMTWNGPVHFYRHGPVIVVYVGSNGGILQKLSDGGGQFAGN